MPRILTFRFVLTIASLKTAFTSAQVLISNTPLPSGFFGSNDFAFEGAFNDGSVPLIRAIETTPTTTLSPEIQQCINSCLASAIIIDKRPVCGSDSVTYDNHQHFDCTLTCGKNGIKKVYTDKCPIY